MVTVNASNRKFLVPLEDGLAVEAVWYGSGTLCISTQAGCPLGCPFCASGALGWSRNLRREELWGQYRCALEAGCAVERLTLSGVGEPLLNAGAVFPFLEECREQGLPVSLTTTGIPLAGLPGVLVAPHNGIMFSVHAGTADVYRLLVPKGPDFEEFWRTLREGMDGLSRRRRRLVGVNYLLLEGVNDGDGELAELARRLVPFPEITLHLLSCNPVPGSSYRSPSDERVGQIYDRLCGLGINVRRANRWRRSATGGCGTLVATGVEKI